ncbi:MAG: RlmE family RNA methyltransferase [Acetobacteraceae bacterium]
MSRDPRGGAGHGPSRRSHIALQSAAGRSASSQRWLARQLNDPYVEAAKSSGFRSRSAYKLLELNERFRLIKRGARVVDLGAAPGGWSQAALAAGAGRLVAIDLQNIEPIAGAIVVTADAADPDLAEKVRQILGGAADVVLSDMAAAATGHAATDHLRIMALAETAFALAAVLLGPGGCFVVKLFQGGAEKAFLTTLQRHFTTVRHAKPPASRPQSRELYLVAKGCRPPA